MLTYILMIMSAGKIQDNGFKIIRIINIFLCHMILNKTPTNLEIYNTLIMVHHYQQYKLTNN